jgi:DNA-binding winged helix-turn-helix (wHTH) protein/tetratricopeptide (TPR) repeat protein
MSLTSKRVYQFGDFKLRVSARVLERCGKPVPLGSKAFEVLTCLVMNAGEVVTKETLLKTVWPESFVEEGNLSQHIFALRKAMGDRATYIVTIPGRGYQFTEAVRDVTELSAPVPTESGTFLLQRTRERTHIVIEETSQTSSGEQPLTMQDSGPSYEDGSSVRSRMQEAGGATIVRAAARSGVEIAEPEEVVVSGPLRPRIEPEQLALPDPGSQKRVPVWTVAGVSAAALLGLWLAAHRLTRPAALSQRVVLAELDNRTGDSGFDVVLRDALEIDLDQSPYMDVMSEHEKLNNLRLMGRDPQTILGPEVAREVCERSNRQVLITGSVASVGQTYLLTLEATDCESGKILAGAKAEAANKERTLTALDSASAKLRQGLGESEESLERFQVPIAQATTSSLEALKQYSLGEDLLGRLGKEESEVLPFFERAVELDPQFAMAHAAIATGYYSLGETEMARPEYQKAFDLSAHVSEKERLYIRAHYFSDDKRDVRQGLQAYEMWADIYPRDWGAWLNIENEYSQIGQYDEAIVAGGRALQLDSSRGIVYSTLARNYMHAGRLADAEATALRALSIGRDSNLLRATLYETALLQHDGAAMDREIARSAGKQGTWDFLDVQAQAAMREGRYKHAAELFRSAYDAARGENLPEKADDILVDEASADFNCGMAGDARAVLRRVSQQHADDADAALVEAQSGDVSSAGRFLAAHNSAVGSDTLMTYVYAPGVRGAIALSEGKAAEAIADLQPALGYDYAVGFANIAERGEAYLRAKQPEQAAGEFHKILDHPGVDPVSPLYPLAWLGLARAEAQAGHTQESRADYENFFGQWKQADEDLPIFLIAHREYAALER